MSADRQPVRAYAQNPVMSHVDPDDLSREMRAVVDARLRALVNALDFGEPITPRDIWSWLSDTAPPEPATPPSPAEPAAPAPAHVSGVLADQVIWGLRVALVTLASGPGAEVERDRAAYIKLHAELAEWEARNANHR